MKKTRLALIYGGEGCERRISAMGAKNLLPRFERNRLDVCALFIDKRGVIREGTENGEPVKLERVARGHRFLRENGTGAPIDVAFPLLHGDKGEDGCVQGALECLHLPYVGCGVTAGAVAADKILTKMIAEAIGIPTVTSVYATKNDSREWARRIAEERIGYPMFIKPSGLGSSIGCSAVYSPDGFDAALDFALSMCDRALIEELVEDARELECAYSMTSRFGEVVTPPGEIRLSGAYTYREKYGKHSTASPMARADVPSTVAELAREYTLKMVRALGIRQMARIDFFLSGKRLMLNEINTIPGFTPTSLYTTMLSECGIPTEKLLSALVEDAYDRRF